MTIFYNGAVNVFDVPAEKVIIASLRIIHLRALGMFTDCVSTMAGTGAYGFSRQGIYSKPTQCSPEI
jgi:hypothetical protein